MAALSLMITLQTERTQTMSFFSAEKKIHVHTVILLVELFLKAIVINIKHSTEDIY